MDVNKSFSLITSFLKKLNVHSYTMYKDSNPVVRIYICVNTQILNAWGGLRDYSTGVRSQELAANFSCPPQVWS